MYFIIVCKLLGVHYYTDDLKADMHGLKTTLGLKHAVKCLQHNVKSQFHFLKQDSAKRTKMKRMWIGDCRK